MARSIATGISLAAFSLTMAVVLTLGTSSYIFTRHTLKELVNKSLSLEASLIGNRLESRLNSIDNDMHNMAENLIVVNALVDSTGREMYVEPFFRSYQLPQHIPCILTLNDFTGKPLISNQGKGKLRHYSDEPLLPQVITDQQPLAQLKSAGEETTLLIAYPVFYAATGMPEGILAIELPLVPFITNLLPQLPQNKDTAFTLSAGNKEIWTTVKGPTIPSLSSTTSFKLSAPLDQLALTLTVSQSTIQAYASLSTLTLMYLAIGALVLLLVIIGSQIMGRKLTAPLISLTQTANKIARDCVPDSPHPLASNDEIAQLTSAFNTMLAGLQDSQTTLESRVVERTDQLADAMQTLNTILENAPIGVAKIIDRKQVWTNRKAEDIFQYSKEEMEFQTTRKLYPSDEAYEKLGREAYPILAEGLVFETEQELIRKDGVHILVRFIGKALLPQDMSQGAIWLLEDITQRKQAEETIKASEEKFRTIANYTYAWEIWESPMGECLYCSPSCERVTGYSADAFMADSGLLKRLIHPEDLLRWTDHHTAVHDKSADTQQTGAKVANKIDFRIFHLDGEVRWISHTCYSICDTEGRNLGHRISNQDITDRKKAEEALYRSEKKLKQAQTVAEIGSWHLNIPDNRLEWSEETYHLFGIPQQQDTDIKTFLSIVHPDDREKVLTAWNEAIAGANYDIEHRIMVGEKILWVRERAEIERDSKGRPLSGIGTVQNITGLKHSEEQIKKLAQELQTILDTLTVSVSFIKNRKVQWTNAAHDRIFGYAPEESKGLDTSTFYADENGYKRVGEGYAKLTHGAAYSAEAEMKSKDGRRFWCSLIGRALAPDNPHEGSIWMIQDISERKAAEDKLRSFAEMQTVLLREVNHRVKNNLVAIISMLHQEEDQARKNGMQEYQNFIQEVVWRVSGLLTVHQLLSSSQWKPLPLSQLCKSVIQETFKAIPHSYSIHLTISPSEVCVDSDQAHSLAMVLNELSTNTIKYAFGKRDKARITVLLQRLNNDIDLIYQDDGPGLPAPLLQGDFSDSGIGINLIYGLVTKNLQGTIDLTNNNGAQAHITFPAMPPEEAS